MTDAELVRAAIAATGLTRRAFAEQVAEVNEATVGRWLKGTSTIRNRAQRARIAAAAAPPRTG